MVFHLTGKAFGFVGKIGASVVLHESLRYAVTVSHAQVAAEAGIEAQIVHYGRDETVGARKVVILRRGNVGVRVSQDGSLHHVRILWTLCVYDASVFGAWMVAVAMCGCRQAEFVPEAEGAFQAAGLLRSLLKQVARTW